MVQNVMVETRNIYGIIEFIIVKNLAENKLSQIETKLQLQSYRNLNRVL